MAHFEEMFKAFIWQDYTSADWILAADLWSHRHKRGLPVADADLLIGVFARNRNAILVTNNELDFQDLAVCRRRGSIDERDYTQVKQNREG